jgi:hypothetical protein
MPAILRCGIFLSLVASLAACAVADMVFETREVPQSRVPPNATEYRCDGGKSFFVRTTDPAAAWVILPEREFRLDKAAGSAGRYENRVARLDLSGEQATLTDGPESFTGCKLTRDAK